MKTPARTSAHVFTAEAGHRCRGIALLALALPPLAACAPHPAARPAVALAAPAPADPRSPDGDWRGSSTRFQAEGRGCPGPGLVNAQVIDRQFQLRWGGRATIPVAIAADGTVSGQSGDVTLTGKFSGNAIIADATSPTCGLHYTLHRAT